MQNLLAPLEELTSKEIKSGEILNSKIPIPVPDYLKKVGSKSDIEVSASTKYYKEFEKFCEWSALPKDLRDPPTAAEFEKKHLLPANYTSAYFKNRDDFQDKRLAYFWDWMMDLYPDVVYGMYKRAIRNSPTDARAFAEILGKRMELDKPKVNVQPMVLMGIPQDKIDKLFTAPGYENIKDITPKPK